MMQKHLRKIIVGVLVLVGGMSSCSASDQVLDTVSQALPVDGILSSPVAQGSNARNFATLERSIYQQINQYRQSRNLPPLTLDERISQQARQHSQAMASNRVPFGHNGFEGRVQAVSKAIPYRRAAENVAFNQGYADPAKEAVQGWIKSPGHRQNMEGNFDLTGIGITKNAKGEYYFTQIFIKRR